MAVVLSKLSGTDYDFLSLLKGRYKAKRRLFVAAQNHYFLVREDHRTKIWNGIHDWLAEDNERVIEFLMCDYKVDHAIDTWSFVVHDKHYEMHLLRATAVFQSWQEKAKAQAKAKGLNDGKASRRLVVKLTTLVPVSITFVDPPSVVATSVDTSSGCRPLMVVTPNAYQRDAHARMAVAIPDGQDEVLRTYWRAYRQVWHDPDNPEPDSRRLDRKIACAAARRLASKLGLSEEDAINLDGCMEVLLSDGEDETNTDLTVSRMQKILRAINVESVKIFLQALREVCKKYAKTCIELWLRKCGGDLGGPPDPPLPG